MLILGLFGDPYRGSWPAALRMFLQRLIAATPNEDRGFRYLISIVISSIFHRHLISIGISKSAVSVSHRHLSNIGVSSVSQQFRYLIGI